MKQGPATHDSLKGAAFNLGHWLVEPGLGRISSEGEEGKLEPRVMEVLVYLARRPGELVTREDLERDVWLGAVVGYDAVTGTVIKLRKALHDRARQPRYIETIPKRGYRLIAPVDYAVDKAALPVAPAVGEGPPDGPMVERPPIPAGSSGAKAAVTRKRAWVPFVLAAILVLIIGAAFIAGRVADEGGAPVLSLPDRPSLAVLPFENLSDDPADDYFSDGMTDDLITDLSALPDIFLISRHSSFFYKDKPVDPHKVGTELGVRYLVVGSVRRAGETLRVNAQLVDTLHGQQLWAERFDRKAADIFTVQDQINARIMDALSLTLGDGQAALSGRQTASPAAYDAYLQGMSHFWRATADDYDRAYDFFQHAIALDPDYADAYAALAALHWQAYKRGWYRNQPWLGLSWEKIMDALNMAKKQPSALAYFVDSGVYTTNHRHDLAVAQAREAVAQFPNDALVHLTLADALSFAGQPAEARRSAEQGLRLDPRQPEPYLFALGRAQFEMGRMEDAVDTLRIVVSANETDVLPRTLLVSALGHLGRMEEAHRQLMDLEALYRQDRLRRLNLRDLGEVWPYREQENLERIRQGLRMLGVPEW